MTGFTVGHVKMALKLSFDKAFIECCPVTYLELFTRIKTEFVFHVNGNIRCGIIIVSLEMIYFFVYCFEEGFPRESNALSEFMMFLIRIK